MLQIMQLMCLNGDTTHMVAHTQVWQWSSMFWVWTVNVYMQLANKPLLAPQSLQQINYRKHWSWQVMTITESVSCDFLKGISHSYQSNRHSITLITMCMSIKQPMSIHYQFDRCILLNSVPEGVITCYLVSYSLEICTKYVKDLFNTYL